MVTSYYPEEMYMIRKYTFGIVEEVYDTIYEKQNANSNTPNPLA